MSADDRPHQVAGVARDGLSAPLGSPCSALLRTGRLLALVGGLAFFGPTPCVSAERAPLPPQPAGLAWPTRTWPTGMPVPGSDSRAMAAAFDAAFQGREPLLGETRAVIVVEGGRIVAERYADGFGPDTRFVSWSMAKSITHALVGAAVWMGRVARAFPALPTGSNAAAGN
jgi:CubicO group peptidase (beta-lactamase class C family)